MHHFCGQDDEDLWRSSGKMKKKPIGDLRTVKRSHTVLNACYRQIHLTLPGLHLTDPLQLAWTMHSITSSMEKADLP